VGDSRKSWPNILKHMKNTVGSTRNRGSIYHSGRYSIDVRSAIFGANLRTYIWKGGTYRAPDPRAGQPWCFAYGEREWVSGATWQSAYDDAQDRNPDTGEVQIPQGRVSCTN
jgi:hypothetical protein